MDKILLEAILATNSVPAPGELENLVRADIIDWIFARSASVTAGFDMKEVIAQYWAEKLA